MDNEELTERFERAGRSHGYQRIKAEFVGFREFKIRWSRSYQWAEFQISDYLKDAPGEIIDGLATTIFSRIRGESAIYPTEVRDWMGRPEFARSNQGLYIRRFTGISKTGEGSFHDLYRSYARLIASGLVKNNPDVYLGWARPGSTRNVGNVSVLMKVVAMSTSLDNSDVDEDLLDFCLYSQLARIEMGYDPTIKNRGPEYDALLSRFPQRDEMEIEVSRMGMHLR